MPGATLPCSELSWWVSPISPRKTSLRTSPKSTEGRINRFLRISSVLCKHVGRLMGHMLLYTLIWRTNIKGLSYPPCPTCPRARMLTRGDPKLKRARTSKLKKWIIIFKKLCIVKSVNKLNVSVSRALTLSKIKRQLKSCLVRASLSSPMKLGFLEPIKSTG